MSHLQITDEERPLIEELRTATMEILSATESNDEMFLVRWLRARDKDVAKAEEMLRANKTWRTTFCIDTIATKPLPPIYEEKYPRKVVCHTQTENIPVIFVPFGTWDVPFTVLSEQHTQDFNDYTVRNCELLMEEIKKADGEVVAKEGKQDGGQRVTQVALIVDMAGFGFMNLLNVYAVQNGLSLLQIYEANYPETLHSCFLINCSSSVGMILNLVKGVLAERTYNKIKVYYTDQQAEFHDDLKNFVGEEERIPEWLGGCALGEDTEKGVELCEKQDDDSDVEEAEEAAEAFEDALDEFHDAKE